jgi:hypothetical protein
MDLEAPRDLIRATVLDRDNQPLATGTATPRFEGVHGVFWIDNPKKRTL